MGTPLMEQAVKEGITFDDNQNEGQPLDATLPDKTVETDASAKSSEAQVEKSGGEPAKPASTEQTNTVEPFHKHPKWKAMTDENRAYKERLEQMEAKYQQFLENSILQQRQGNQQPSINPEQRQALLQLATLLKDDPEAASLLGLNNSRQLEQAFENMQNEKVSEGFWGEFDNVVDKFATTYGIPKDELGDELQTFLQTDNRFSSLPFSKGAVEAAAQVMLFGRLEEITERKINGKLIKDKQLKASNNTESTSKDGQSGSKGVDLSAPGGIMERIRQAGGLSI
jgi:hypothetical protein